MAFSAELLELTDLQGSPQSVQFVNLQIRLVQGPPGWKAPGPESVISFSRHEIGSCAPSRLLGFQKLPFWKAQAELILVHPVGLQLTPRSPADKTGSRSVPGKLHAPCRWHHAASLPPAVTSPTSSSVPQKPRWLPPPAKTPATSPAQEKLRRLWSPASLLLRGRNGREAPELSPATPLRDGPSCSAAQWTHRALSSGKLPFFVNI